MSNRSPSSASVSRQAKKTEPKKGAKPKKTGKRKSARVITQEKKKRMKQEDEKPYTELGAEQYEHFDKLVRAGATHDQVLNALSRRFPLPKGPPYGMSKTTFYRQKARAVSGQEYKVSPCCETDRLVYVYVQDSDN